MLSDDFDVPVELTVGEKVIVRGEEYIVEWFVYEHIYANKQCIYCCRSNDESDAPCRDPYAQLRKRSLLRSLRNHV